MSVTVREYRDSDFEACRRLWGELSQYHAEIYEDASIADEGKGLGDYLTRGDRLGLWVAEENGRVVGFAGLINSVMEETIAEIEPVVVESSSRGKGIGTALVRYATEEARKRGFRSLSIRPELRNEEAFALYVRLGFNHIGAVQLFKELSPASDRKWKSGIRIHGEELLY